MPIDPAPFTDQAKPILEGDPAISQEQKADLWDIFHQTKDPQELAQKLSPLAVPDDLKAQLYSAKRRAAPKIEPIARTVVALRALTQIPQAVKEEVEKYPNTAKALLSAADKAGENEAAEAQESSKAAGKGKEDGSKAKAQQLVQPPRTDGSRHLPPIPEGHRRVLASDGGLHDIPEDRIEDARAIDPNLHVLNP